MRVMTHGERRAFLTDGTRTAKLATARPDGRPHVAPIWFVLDGDDILFTTHQETVKGRSLRRDGRLALCVDDQEPPYSFVLIEGEATISDNLDELRHWAARIGTRYMGEDRAEEFGQRNGVPGELLVRVRPTHVVAHAAMTD